MLHSDEVKASQTAGQTSAEPAESFIPQQFMQGAAELGQTQSNRVKPPKLSGHVLSPRMLATQLPAPNPALEKPWSPWTPNEPGHKKS